MLCSLLLLRVTVAIENLASCSWILCSWSYGCVTLQHQNLHDFSQLLLENRRRKQTSQKLKVIRDFRKTCIRPKLSVTYICIPLVRVLWRVLPVFFSVLDTDQPPVPTPLCWQTSVLRAGGRVHRDPWCQVSIVLPWMSVGTAESRLLLPQRMCGLCCGCSAFPPHAGTMAGWDADSGVCVLLCCVNRSVVLVTGPCCVFPFSHLWHSSLRIYLISGDTSHCVPIQMH